MLGASMPSGRADDLPRGHPEPVRLGIPDRDRHADRDPAAAPSHPRAAPGDRAGAGRSRWSTPTGTHTEAKELRGAGLHRQLLLHELPVDLPGDHAGHGGAPERVRASAEIQGIRLVCITRRSRSTTRRRSCGTYAASIGAEPSRWTLLTGDPAAIRKVVVDGFKTPMEPARRRRPSPWTSPIRGRSSSSTRPAGFAATTTPTELGLDEVYNRAQHVRGK